MSRSRSGKINPRVEIKVIDGIDHRECIDCGKWFPFDHQWGKPYCKKCVNFRNKLQKEKGRRDPNRKKVRTFLVDGIEHRLCHRCGCEIVYNPSISYCKECAAIIARINYRDKKKHIIRGEKLNRDEFKNKAMAGLFEGYYNEDAKNAMIKGDFIAFMKATENGNGDDQRKQYFQKERSKCN